MKIGYTLWTWLMDEHNSWEPMSPNGKRDFEQALREVSDLGYQVFENFNVLATLYEDSHAEFDALLKKYGLEFVNLYHYIKSDFEQDLALGERCCKFLQAHGVKLMNMQTPWDQDPDVGRDATGFAALNRPSTEAELKQNIEQLTRMGKMAQKYGVTMCLHPHYGTTVFYEEAIDYVIERIPADMMALCIDTAHTALAGMDPIATIKKYYDRIKFIHLKDLDPDYPKEAPMRGFRALGEGVLDIKGAVNALKSLGYDGYLIVECDRQRVCNYETAMVSRDYIRRVLGI